MSQLPTRLYKEPLIDVVFEVRFQTSVPASNFLPGPILQAFPGARFERTAMADIPSNLREVDPTLRYAPLFRVVSDEFVMLISDNSAGVGCQMPYAGWKKYKEKILLLIDALKQVPFITHFERTSIKYIDFLDSTTFPNQSGLVNLDLKIGAHKLNEEAFQVRIEIPEGEYIKIIQVISTVTLTDSHNLNRTGTMVDVDIVRLLNFNQEQYLASIDTILEELHEISKRSFFDCISEETLIGLEPQYD